MPGSGGSLLIRMHREGINLDVCISLEQGGTMTENEILQRRDKPATARPDTVLTLGMWGLPESGKTTFLAMLTRAISQEEWSIYARDQPSRQMLAKANKRLFLEEVYPLRSSETRRCWFTVSMPVAFPGRGEVSFHLGFLDTKGIDFDLIEQVESEVFQHLSKCKGILFLIDSDTDHGLWPDPKERHTNLYLRLGNALSELRILGRAPRVRPLIAFCLTKVDLRSSNLADRCWADPQSFGEELIGQAATEVIWKFCEPKRVEWFSCSATGFCNIDGEKVSQRYKAEDGEWRVRDASQLAPVRLTEPIEWLLKEIRREQKKGLRRRP